MAPSAGPGSKDFRFVNLPGEIKNRIYRCAVVSPSPILLRVHNRADTQRNMPDHALLPYMPAIGRTCKEVRREVSGIYFEENTFTFTESTLNHAAIETFMKMSGDSAARTTKLNIIHTVSRHDSNGDWVKFFPRLTI